MYTNTGTDARICAYTDVSTYINTKKKNIYIYIHTHIHMCALIAIRPKQLAASKPLRGVGRACCKYLRACGYPCCLPYRLKQRIFALLVSILHADWQIRFTSGESLELSRVAQWIIGSGFKPHQAENHALSEGSTLAPCSRGL